METLRESRASASQTALQLRSTSLFCLIGVLLGTLIGVLPGIGPTATIAMLLPLTFALVAGDRR